jgi:hypothetical protein
MTGVSHLAQPLARAGHCRYSSQTSAANLPEEPVRSRPCHLTSQLAGRPSSRRRLATVALAVAAAGWSAAAAATGTGTGRAWHLKLAIHYLPPATNRSQYDAVIAEPGQTWLFGGSDIGGHGTPEIERITNGVPHAAGLPAGAHSWIAAASAASSADTWAVTYLGGTVLRWNGSYWSAASRGGWQPGTRFTGITAVSRSDVWVFGTAGHRYPGAGTWHLSGSAWTRVRGVAAGIFQASKAGPAEIWAVGNAGAPGNALFRFGGGSWRRVRPASLAGFRYSRVLAGGARDVWVAGSVAGTPRLGHYNGRRWSLLRMPGTTVASGLCRDGRRGLWVIANAGSGPSGVLDRSAAGTWRTVPVSSHAADKVLACSLLAGTQRTWGAGQAEAPRGTAAAGYRYG